MTSCKRDCNSEYLSCSEERKIANDNYNYDSKAMSGNRKELQEIRCMQSVNITLEEEEKKLRR